MLDWCGSFHSGLVNTLDPQRRPNTPKWMEDMFDVINRSNDVWRTLRFTSAAMVTLRPCPSGGDGLVFDSQCPELRCGCSSRPYLDTRS